MLGGGLGMRRAETAPAELPLEALAKGPAAGVHALDLAAPTRRGARGGRAAAGECKPGRVREPLAAGKGLAWGHAGHVRGEGGAGGSTIGGQSECAAAGVSVGGRDSGDTPQDARAAGFDRALAGSGAEGRLRGNASVVVDRSRLGGEGGNSGTLSGPGPPGSERASR